MSETYEKTERFSDNGNLIYEFGDEFLVICPKCKSLAKVFRIEIGSEKLNQKLSASRKLVCLNCVYRAKWNGGQISIGASIDWYFGLPLWLEIECCDEKLWAYNEKHLNFIEDYVSAKLRERMPNRNKSLASRLPKWITSAKNRDEILKAIGKLREKLNGKS